MTIMMRLYKMILDRINPKDLGLKLVTFGALMPTDEPVEAWFSGQGLCIRVSAFRAMIKRMKKRGSAFQHKR